MEVYPSRYSPADLPSSTRAAPAKKRIWSAIAGISSSMVSPMGLPVFSDSARTSSSARSSMASASLSRASCRSLGVESRHDSKALSATSNARSTSVPPETGASAKASPVAGLMRSEDRPSPASTRSPPTKFCSLFFLVSTMSSPFPKLSLPRLVIRSVPAPCDYLAQPLLRAHAQGLAVGQDHGRKIFREQLLRRASGLRGVHADRFADAH